MRLPEPENSRAVFVGTTTYSGVLEHKPLPGVRGNVEDLSEVLSDPRFGGFLPEHCVRLIDEGNANEIVRRVKAAAEEAVDVLLVYIAGHAEPKHDSFELYFCLPGNDVTDALWHLEALRYAEIRDAMRASPARNKIVIVDSCFSGLALPDSMSAEPATMFTVYGAYNLTSVGPNELAAAPAGERWTAFTGKLIQLLTEGIDGQDELLPLQDLFPYLRSGLLIDGQPSPRQHSAGTAGHLALVRNRAYRPEPDGGAVIHDPVTTEPSPPVTDPGEAVGEVGPAAQIRERLSAPLWVSFSTVTGCCSAGALALSGQTLVVSLLWATPIAVIAHLVAVFLAA